MMGHGNGSHEATGHSGGSEAASTLDGIGGTQFISAQREMLLNRRRFYREKLANLAEEIGRQAGGRFARTRLAPSLAREIADAVEQLDDIRDDLEEEATIRKVAEEVARQVAQGVCREAVGVSKAELQAEIMRRMPEITAAARKGGRRR